MDISSSKLPDCIPWYIEFSEGVTDVGVRVWNNEVLYAVLEPDSIAETL
jgi:hypothetical protein